MASSVDNELAKHMECGICWERFEEPKMLTCQHSYCKRCLERLVTEVGRQDHEIKCPECRKETKVRKKSNRMASYKFENKPW